MSIDYINLGKELLSEFISNLSPDDREYDKLLLRKAYEIQNNISELRIEDNDSLAGFKVGCTSPTIQQSLGIQHPIFGCLFHSEIWPSGSTLSLDRFHGLAIEGELAVRLNDENPSKLKSSEQILSRIESIFPVIELHHLNFLDQPPSAPRMVACNAIHAGFVYNQIDSCQLSIPPRELIIEIDGQEIAHIGGHQLMNTVESSLYWLEQQLEIQNLRLEPKQFILCGSLGDLFSWPHGGQIKVRTDTNQSVNCNIEDE